MLCALHVPHAPHYSCHSSRVVVRMEGNLSVWVGLRYTDDNSFSPSLVTRTSRKGSLSSFSSSTVNCILGCCWLRWLWNDCSSSCPWGQMTNVSSTYLTHSLGLRQADCRAVSSRCSRYRLAIAGDRGDPIAAPSNCS